MGNIETLMEQRKQVQTEFEARITTFEDSAYPNQIPKDVRKRLAE